MSSGPNYPRPRKQVFANTIWPCKTRIVDILDVAVVAVIVSAHMRTMVLAVDMAMVVAMSPAPSAMSTVLL